MRKRLRESWLWDESLEMPSMWGFIASLAAIIILALGIGFGVRYAVGSRNCAYAQREFHRPTHYDFFARCYINVGNGESIPLSQYRGFKEAR